MPDDEGLADPAAPWEENIEDPNAPRRLLAVMFTDIVGSTELATALGDKRWRELLELQEAAVRGEIARFDGVEVDTAGDAFFATFERPINAVDCALEAARSVRRLGLQIRAGIHMGECVVANDKVRGVTVHIGARVGSKARGDEVLISSTVRDVLGDTELRFSDRGEHSLKGVNGRWHLYAIEPRVRDKESDLPQLLEEQIPKPAPSVENRRRKLIAAGTAVAVLLAVAAFVVFRGPGGLSTVPADSVAEIDAASGTVNSSVPVSRRPVGLAAAPDGVWVANSVDRTVTHVAGSGTTRTVPVGPGPIAVATHGNDVWVANGDGSSVSHVSRTSVGEVGARIQAGNGLTSIAYGAGALWLANSVDGTVWRVDPSSGRKTLEVKAGPTLSAIAANDDSVWVTSETAGTVLQINPTSGVIARAVRVGTGPKAVAIGGGAVWVANSDATASRVAIETGAVRSVRVGRGARAVAITRGHVFVANEDDGTVSMLDAKTGALIRTMTLRNAPMGLAASSDRVWVSVRGGILSYRGGTLRVGTAAVFPSLDPSYGGDPSLFVTQLAVYDGLTALKRVGGPEGNDLVPNLAEEIRPPTDNGTTYTYTLRAGLKYSNGTPVRASDVRATFERIMSSDGTAYGSAFLSAIKGSERCTPKACDLSAGVITDDRARTIVLHLRHALADFPYQLALSSLSILPASAPKSDAGLTPIPGTGPYRFTDIKLDPNAGGTFALERNPYFKPRGQAQTDGYPDRIEFITDPAVDHIAAVKAGKEDVTLDLFDPSLSIGQLATELPAQLHLFDAPFILFVSVNTHVPPFNNLLARRAVNFALDREALAGATPSTDATEDVSCQLLPKNTIGYVPYCPYTKNPNPAGVWTAPDLEKARKLVEQSGTKGARVTVWTETGEGFGQSNRRARAPIIAKALNQIGYVARVEELPGDYFEKFTTPGNKLQVGLAGWISDYPAAGNFVLPLATCSDTLQRLAGGQVFYANVGSYCSRKVDALTEQAIGVQQDDPATARDRWAAVDHALSDDSAIMGFAGLRNAVLVSKRVGNVQANAAYGILLTQMWVVAEPKASPS